MVVAPSDVDGRAPGPQRLTRGLNRSTHREAVESDEPLDLVVLDGHTENARQCLGGLELLEVGLRVNPEDVLQRGRPGLVGAPRSSPASSRLATTFSPRMGSAGTPAIPCW